MTMTEACKNCRFWRVDSKSSSGDCCRHAPVAARSLDGWTGEVLAHLAAHIIDPEQAQSREVLGFELEDTEYWRGTLWPKTYDDDWRGEYEPKVASDQA